MAKIINLIVIILISIFILNLKIDNSNNEKEKNVIINEISTVTYSFDLSNPEDLYNNHEYIAIIHIDKVNPARTYRKKTNEYILPYTSGSATVLKVIKGTFSNSNITFLRLGGIVSVEEYQKSLSKEEATKFNNSLINKSKKNLYVNSSYKNDISIEANKNYLVYMNRNDDFHEEDEFSIEAFEYGLREVQIPNEESKELLLSNITVKNNKTNEYEPLEDAVSSKLLPCLNEESY